jgi:hypothetical protein
MSQLHELEYVFNACARAGRVPAFIQNVRRGHYELGADKTVNLRVLAAFNELVLAI